MPNYYNPYYQQAFNQQYPQMQQQPQIMQNQQPQIQTNGLISVRSETEAANYPVQAGNSVTFKDETAPYIYVKTMGFSQLDRPTFDKYRLVKEDVSELTTDNQKADYEAIRGEINALWKAVDELKPKKTTRKKESEGDDE